MRRLNFARTCAPDEGPFCEPVSDYARNLVARAALPRLSASGLDHLGQLPLVRGMARPRVGSGEPLTVASLRRGLRPLLREGGRGCAPRAAGEPAASNLGTIGELFALTRAERAVLQFVAALRESAALHELTCIFGPVTTMRAVALLSVATTLPEGEVAQALGARSRLVSSGIVTFEDRDGLDVEQRLELKAGMLHAILAPGLDEHALLSRFLPRAAPSSLTWGDFSHLERPATMARQLLAAALRERRRGVNVLFHGATGTGKTELARLLADELGARLLVAGREDDHGGSPSAHERLSSLQLGQQLVGADGASLLLFDELEDLFSWHREGVGGASAMSKQWFNALLESNPAPTVWISNRTDGIDPAFLRRFVFAVEFRSLGPRARARALARHLRDGSGLAASDVDAVASRFAVSPAVFGGAVTCARLLSGGAVVERATLEQSLGSIERLVASGGPPAPQDFDAAAYRPELANASFDLAELADRVAGWRQGRGQGLSMCLYGPPGTGKTEYVRWLAHRMGRHALVKRASDVIGSLVGETERRIAAAFRQATDEDAVLVLDEADSFLRDRAFARHSWEVTMVNELLQQLEASRGVVACTTNLWRDVDQAALRRFVLKLEFRFLTPEQAAGTFCQMFAADHGPIGDDDLSMARAAFARQPNLAPGDFAVVARRLRALGVRARPDELVAAVLDEARQKTGAPRPIGF